MSGRGSIQLPGAPARDSRLAKLAAACGFNSVNQLLAHVAHEVAFVKSPAVFYRALANFHDMARKRNTRK